MQSACRFETLKFDLTLERLESWVTNGEPGEGLAEMQGALLRPLAEVPQLRPVARHFVCLQCSTSHAKAKSPKILAQ